MTLAVAREELTYQVGKRFNGKITDFIITGAIGGSDILDFRSCAAALIRADGAYPGSLTFYTALTETGTYSQVYDADGAAVTLGVLQDKFVPFPDEVLAAGFLKFVNASGSAGNTYTILCKA